MMNGAPPNPYHKTLYKITVLRSCWLAGSISQYANFSVHPTTQTFMISLTLKPGTVSNTIMFKSNTNHSLMDIMLLCVPEQIIKNNNTKRRLIVEKN